MQEVRLFVVYISRMEKYTEDLNKVLSDGWRIFSVNTYERDHDQFLYTLVREVPPATPYRG